MFLSQPRSAYQVAEISLDAGHARDIWLMLTDARTVLDDLVTTPATARRAAASLRAADSPYTLPALITALDQVTTMLAHAARDASAANASPPASQPGYTRPAVDAITQAASTEHDFAGWLAGVLAHAAARLGSSNALTARRPGSWEASLVDQLVKGTVGYDDELLPGYAGT
jgi:hypothetical protein